MAHIPMRGRFLALCLLLGLCLGGGCSVAFAATGTRSATSMGMGFNVHAPSNVAVSGFYDGIVPGFDWTYDHYSSADTKISRAANGTVGGASLSGTASRVVSAANIAKVGVKLAKLAGPVSLGLTLADLIWDEVNNQWMKPGELASASPYGYTMGPNGPSYQPGVCTDTSPCSLETWIEVRSGYISQAISKPYTGYELNGTCQAGAEGGTRLWLKFSNGAFTYDECAQRKGNKPQAEPTIATDQDIEDAIYVELVARGMSSDLARRLVDAGYAPDLLPGSGPSITSGPASVPGPSSTSTTQTAAGPVTTVTNTTYNVTYNNQTVNVSETTTTTKTNPDNTTETTTETKTPAPGNEGEVPEEQQPKTDCEKFPDASGCKPLDDVADEDLQQETETVTWSAEGGAAGSCPAPLNWNTQFGTYAIEWTPVCSFASGIRPFVVGIAWLAAGLFIFAVAKEKA